MYTQSCNGVYLNGKRIDADKWVEVKVKDQLCFGTPISNNSFRYVLEQLTNEDYQLVQEEFIAEEELSGGIKKRPSEIGVADTSEVGTVNSEKDLTSKSTSNPDEVATSTSSADGTRRYEMLTSSMQEEFLCVICQELFVKAHSLSCSHSYCEKCIKDWMKTNKHCPMCRKTIEGKPVHSIAMDNAIDKLVKCLPEEAQKERAELLEERNPKKDVILISDSPVRPGTSSGVVTRSVSRRNNPVHVISSDSDSELSSSEDDVGPERHEGFDYGDDSSSSSSSDELEGYTGLPGYSWGGYGHCYRCGMCLGNVTVSCIKLCLLQGILATGHPVVPTDCIIL